MYRRGRTPRGGGAFGNRRSRSPIRGNDRVYPRRGGDRWGGYSPPRARSPLPRSPPTGPRRRRSPTPPLNHAQRGTQYRRPSWSRTPPRPQSPSPQRRPASRDSAPKPSPYIPQSRPRSRSPIRNADSRHESPRHLVRRMESSPALSGGVNSRGQVSPATHSAPRSPPSRVRSPPRGPRNGISPQPPINGSAIHPDRLHQLASSTNGFSSTPPRGPAGNGRPPPTQSRGGGHTGYGTPRVQPQIPPTNATRTPIPQRNGLPMGPRRGSAATGASGTPPPAIPTGPRAGNFPYRSTLPTPAPIRYAPAASGPGATIPGGRLLPAFDKASEERLARLRADQAKLEEDVKILQERKRKGLFQWERTKREAEKEGFRAEVAEQYLLGEVMME
ncbi:hypothetical protein EDC01DRAFT_631568 [Geopyxis carbonaria]|nr:hypothetical protein EDC01DRAFT_631568 [Geopyxis carbonaria]